MRQSVRQQSVRQSVGRQSVGRQSVRFYVSDGMEVAVLPGRAVGRVVRYDGEGSGGGWWMVHIPSSGGMGSVELVSVHCSKMLPALAAEREAAAVERQAAAALEAKE